ncbi:hypothetical protein DI392_00940 [Vibrio albus]|uniref:Uncharacterized protein n=1 Tax=Vibrio albus TaxID=2200953 RepID=A0A2U3BDJ6_9VIBR|nr:hypothetical protein [Vibrio albus]PWI34879.1 hypothetical protein DI392_00940 [Vibrio albus]
MECSRCGNQPVLITEPVCLCEECALDTALAILASCRLSDASVNALIQSGFDMPVKTHQHFSATDIAKELGTSAQKIGRLANKHNLKTDQFGEWRLGKAANSSKQIESFFYNESGRRQIIGLMR